jgi:hypothetical protein
MDATVIEVTHYGGMAPVGRREREAVVPANRQRQGHKESADWGVWVQRPAIEWGTERIVQLKLLI